MRLESGSISRPAQLESGLACALDGLACTKARGQSTVNDQSPSHVKSCDYKTCENEATSMEPFQQYLVETFPEDGKRSTSVVVHELDLTVNAC